MSENMSQPKVSIIIPVYNADKTISKCIESVIRQSFEDWELIVVDDGSQDDSGMICDEFALKDNRINVYHIQNRGVSGARNFGLDIAKGQWIVFIDSDDWCEKDYLAAFFSLATEELKSFDFVLQGVKFEQNGDVVRIIRFDNSVNANIVDCLIKNELLLFGAPYCKLYSREIILSNKLRFPLGYSYGEDTVFFYSYLMYVNRMLLVENCEYHYVLDAENSLSKKKHDFNPLKMFLLDSVKYIKKLNNKHCENNKLLDAYNSIYISLVLYSIACMYRLCYDAEETKRCFHIIKKELLPQVGFSWHPLILVLKYIPTILLEFFFRVIMYFRK